MHFTHILFTALATLTLYAGGVLSLGINCDGSGLCDLGSNIMSQMVDVIVNQLNPSDYFDNGVQIACVDSFCAFCQNSNGAPGSSIIALIQDLQEHGCKDCGSIPLFWPQGDNNVADGELTVNVVNNPCVASAKSGGGLCVAN